ncbi:ComF family protein [Gynuella sp.]|uniref:ComF family protein n=1 Tax=Gynuella sp. TaxID=2969146 RepID=UPI003D09C98F
MESLHFESCHICRKPIGNHAKGLCRQCWSLWPVLSDCCQICAIPLTMGRHVCGHCLRHIPAFDQVISSGRYEGILAWLIKQLKYHNRHQHVRPLAEAMTNTIRQFEITTPEALIPMPLHWSRQWARGFNQSDLLARAIGQNLNIPVRSDLVTRYRRTPALEGLDRKTRLKLLKKVFKVKTDGLENVAVIDDVVTTTASAQSLAAMLKRHGVRHVQVWTMARTPEQTVY